MRLSGSHYVSEAHKNKINQRNRTTETDDIEEIGKQSLSSLREYADVYSGHDLWKRSILSLKWNEEELTESDNNVNTTKNVMSQVMNCGSTVCRRPIVTED